MQQRPYTREEHFHAVEKKTLRPLPETPYVMKRYADVTVQQNGHIYLSCDKHYYSVPFQLIGCRAKVIFTCSLVKIYVKGEQVAVHPRERTFGYSSREEHLASTTLARPPIIKSKPSGFPLRYANSLRPCMIIPTATALPNTITEPAN